MVRIVFATRKHLSRRFVLQGCGAMLALPLLDAMVPAHTNLKKTAAAAAGRFMAIEIVHGAAGISYFCHQMMPDFNETDCLDDPPTLAALTEINAQLLELAPLLNTQSFSLSPQSTNPSVPVHAVLKKRGSERYVFSVSMADGATTARFALTGIGSPTSVEVIGEGRNLTPLGEFFEDAFNLGASSC